LNLDLDMLIERRLAFASRGLLRGGARRNFSVQVADLDANKRGIPIPSMPAGEEFLKAKAAIKEHAIHTTALWRRISIFVCLPTIALGLYWVIDQEKKHKEHIAHHPPEYTPYSYLNRRVKDFPWGKNSLFFNPHAQQDMSKVGEEE